MKTSDEIGPSQGSLFSTATRLKRAASEAAAPASERALGNSSDGAGAAVRQPLVGMPLYLGRAEIAAIQRLIKFAGEERVPLEEMKRRVKALQRGDKLPSRYNMRFTIKIPFGYSATYTIEEQPQGWARHLSVSVEQFGGMPNSNAVEMLMREFGFRRTGIHEAAAAWLEPIGNDRKATNVLEYIDPADGAPVADEFIADPDAEPEE
jgi:hypothetical protein